MIGSSERDERGEAQNREKVLRRTLPHSVEGSSVERCMERPLAKAQELPSPARREKWCQESD